MIQVPDLCIGNWVYDGERTQFPMQVVGIGSDYVYLDFPQNEGDLWESKPEELQGIPLTGELLKKIGFEEHKDNVLKEFSYYRYWDKEHKYKLDVCDIYTNSDRRWHAHIDNEDCCSLGSGEFDYVHELQNLVRIITKKELKVNLWN